MALTELASGGWRVVAHRQVTYDVRVQRGLLDVARPRTLLNHDDQATRRLFVVDREVWRQYRLPISAWIDRLGGPRGILRITTSESAKNPGTVARIVRAAVGMDLARRDEIIAIGGGILLDLAGLAAAELRKGTPYIAIPTTLVGLVDAALGAKRAVNRFGKKNLLGAYHPARLVLLDPGFLATLDRREICAGFAEIKKVGEMVDPGLISMLEVHGPDLINTALDHAAADDLMRRAVSGILGHLASDLYEGELCRWPGFGHTISPTLEMESGGRIVHGEAVNICSLLSATLAHSRGLVPDDYPARMVRLSRRLGLPVFDPLLGDPGFLRRAVASTTLTRGGKQHWPVPSTQHDKGHTFIEDASAGEIDRAARTLHKLTGVDG